MASRDTNTLPKWRRPTRIAGLIVLAVVTAYGLYEFVTGDWSGVTAYWRERLALLPLIVGFAMVDVALEGVSWIWIAERLGLRTRDRIGVRVFLSGKAGLLLPAQLGRLIRPDALVRLGRGTPAECLKVEAAAFALDSLSVAALLAGLGALLVHPALAPLAVAGAVLVPLFLASQLSRLLSRTGFNMPPSFWWSWRSLVTVVVLMVGWAANGLAFYLVVSDLPGTVRLWDALFIAPASAVLGVGTGLPGGVGATEGLLGVSLRLNGVPAAHLAMAVAAFRLVTFWAWIPVGWVVLTRIGRRAKKLEALTAVAETSGTTEAPIVVATNAIVASGGVDGSWGER